MNSEPPIAPKDRGERIAIIIVACLAAIQIAALIYSIATGTVKPH